MSGTGFTESTHETGKSYTQGGAIGLERATAGHMNGVFSHFLVVMTNIPTTTHQQEKHVQIK
jgi:hypothetical protein